MGETRGYVPPEAEKEMSMQMPAEQRSFKTELSKHGQDSLIAAGATAIVNVGAHIDNMLHSKIMDLLGVQKDWTNLLTVRHEVSRIIVESPGYTSAALFGIFLVITKMTNRYKSKNKNTYGF